MCFPASRLLYVYPRNVCVTPPVIGSTGTWYEDISDAPTRCRTSTGKSGIPDKTATSDKIGQRRDQSGALKKSAHTGARKSEEKVWNPGGEIREENVFGYSVKKQ